MVMIKELQRRILKNKLDHKFNTTDIELEFLLAYGELAEAFEAWHKKKPDLGEELADTVIYILGIAEILGIDLHKEVEMKMDKNEKRKYSEKNGVLIKEDI